MEEKTPEKDPELWNDSKEEEMKTISLKRHLWPDEEALRKEKKKNKKLRIILIVSIIVCFAAGFIARPYIMALTSGNTDSADKIQKALSIMENDWYFGKDIDNLDERLTDQAISGITNNKEDTHTEYMTADEMKDFTNSINRNYVGIGVEFINTDGKAIIDKVFRDSPAEKAGVQAGDIIHTVNDEDITGYTSDKIKELVQGKEGTSVTIGFIRQGKNIALKITRAAVSASTFGEMKDNGIAYLQLYQFGDTTPDLVKAYLDDFKKENAQKLIIDLRDNGGGYLDSVSEIASCFLPEGSTVLEQEYKNGDTRITKTSDEQYSDLGPIVILVNQNTASAAEVLTLALSQQRDDVTVMGTTTYGKGTVQVSTQFTDGSALKYTTSRWLSPKGDWINGKGITPDVEVKLPDVFYETFAGMKDDETYAYDSVSDAVKDAQMCLLYLGYTVDREDGYFSQSTQDAIKQFQSDHSLSGDGVLNEETYSSLRSAVLLSYETDDTKDTQLMKAEEKLNG